MTIKLLAVTFVFAFLAGCGGEKHAVGFCLGSDGTTGDCDIACTIHEDEDSCAKWADLTKKLCASVSKAKCQEICEKDKNPTACEAVKTMK